ncbi:MAG: protein tyrosine phosphatase [Verrucomicrobia bacterium]|nr:protein tyrosine phosphatase [Verrucomicrobiota bacterium]
MPQLPPTEPPTRVLFVCSRNRIRSLTAERLFAGVPGYEVRSAGTEPGARMRVTPGLLGWAEAIFVMEPAHRRILQERFAGELADRTLVVLHIPDEFEYLDDELIEVLRGALGSWLELPAEETP